MVSPMFDLAKTVQPYTMASPERVQLVIDLARRANNEYVFGDFVECGVCNGGLGAILAYHGSTRKTWLFDSFQGLPACGVNDLPSANGNTAESEVGKCVGDIDNVCELLRKIPQCGEVQFVPGWFAETFPSVNIPRIAFLILDSDWYSSEKLCLEKFYDCVVPGGFLYLDDYHYWPGSKLAADEFFKARGIAPTLHSVGHSVWMQK